MYKFDKDFTWDKYFKQVDIYQGRSHWTDLKNLLSKLKIRFPVISAANEFKIVNGVQYKQCSK